jgi:N-acetylglucosaminyldiphosphoundecaprenol N-acetyl-beta-D-mannosaminyltransferase
VFKSVRDRFRDGSHLNVLGVRVHPTNMDEAAETVVNWALSGSGKCRYVCVSGMHGVVEAQSDEGFREILNRADLNVPDGMPLTWLGWFAGWEKMARVYGPDFMLKVCAASAGHGLSHFFYGGNEGVANELAARLQKLFPGLIVAGTYCPPFRLLTVSERESVKGTINHSGARIVWVGLSTPKQEKWMAECASGLAASVVLGVGAAFDYNTGRLQRAPEAIQKAGLEWFFRLLQEPRRLFGRYLHSVPTFIYLIVKQAFLPTPPGTRGSQLR